MKFAALIILFSFLLSASDKDVHNDISPIEKFKGKVKSVTTQYYYRGNNADTLVLNDTYRVTYDTNGKEITNSRLTNNGKAIFIDSVKYDSKGHRLERLTRNNDGTVLQGYAYSYDSKGNRFIQYYYTKDTGLFHTTNYLYDSLGFCIEWQVRNSKGQIDDMRTFAYDSNSNMIEEHILSPRASGNIDTSTYNKFIYSYDAKGLKIEKQQYFHTRKDTLLDVLNFAYDKYGNMTKCITKNSKGEVVKHNAVSTFYKYKYDKAGNWTRQSIRSYGGKVQMRLVRKIEYY